MTKSVRITEEIYHSAEQYGMVYSRSASKQLEFWAKIGKIAEENPDLSYNIIKDALIAKQQIDTGDVVPYEFDN